MAEALALAHATRHLTTPNPSIGCVIVNGGRIVGRGATQPGGRPHAEAMALAQAGDNARGATVYVTLEPCAHQSPRGPACGDLLVAAAPARAVVGMLDVDPRTTGKGVERLRAAGITVDVGMSEAACRGELREFITRITLGRPLVQIKMAATLDGRTALATGKSQWITGAESRRDVHRLRAAACAVLTGFGTVAADNPELTVRHVRTERQPTRIVIDHTLELNANHRLTDTAAAPTHVLTMSQNVDRAEALRALGVRVDLVPESAIKPGKLDLAAAFQHLGRVPYNRVLVESGSKLAGSLIQAGVVDELIVYLAPALLGDTAQSLFTLPALATLADKIQLNFTDVRQVGSDLRITAALMPR
jgi:diaminohydroxyphosphoribosylaminopyrimidine deaminase / 5-amino-6-(5-phosphoribosylamino)uracil reductase